MTPPPEPIATFVVTPHAAEQIARRLVDEALVRRVLAAPEQRLFVRDGRDVLQSRFEMRGRWYLVRVFVDIARAPVEVVTVYRTSKVAKYWRAAE